MKYMLMGTETVPMERFHLVQKLYSFLDIPGAAWDLALLIYLFCCSKRPSRVRAAPRRKISNLGFSFGLAVCRLQPRPHLGQCGNLVSVRRFHHAQSRLVTKRVPLVGGSYRIGSKPADVHVFEDGVTQAALVPFASLVAKKQQSSMWKTSKVVAR
jgi:hypothetical protein